MPVKPNPQLRLERVRDEFEGVRRKLKLAVVELRDGGYSLREAHTLTRLYGIPTDFADAELFSVYVARGLSDEELQHALELPLEMFLG